MLRIALALLLGALPAPTIREDLGVTIRAPSQVSPVGPLTLAGSFTAQSNTQWTTAVLAVAGVNASAGQLMVLLAGQVHDVLQGATGGEVIASIVDTGGNAWTQRVANVGAGAFPNAEIWTAPVTVAIVAGTVTVTYASNFWEPRLTVLVFDNADLATPIGATYIGGGTNRAGGPLSATADVGLTQQAGSLAVAALSRFDNGGAEALTATTVAVDSGGNWSRNVTADALTPAAGATVSIGFVAAPTFASYAGAEVRHAP